MMGTKTKNSIKWVLTGLVALIFIGTGTIKLSGSPLAEEMANALGLNMPTLMILAILELSATLLFIVPRTAILGFLLLSAYMGGAICAHLLTGKSVLFPVLVQAFVWLTAVIRFPELNQRLRNKLNMNNTLK